MIRLDNRAIKILSSITRQAGRTQNLYMEIGIQNPLEAYVVIDHKREPEREIHLHFLIPITGLPQEAELGKLPDGTIMYQDSFYVETSPHMSDMHFMEYQNLVVVKNPNMNGIDNCDSPEFTKILLRSSSDAPRGTNLLYDIDESQNFPIEKSLEIINKRSEYLTGLLVKLEDDITNEIWLD